MKKIIIIVVFCLIVFQGLIVAENNDDGERETVFREIAWGDSLEFLVDEKGFEMIRREDKEVEEMDEDYYGLKVYERENENLELGTIDLWEIEYYFFEDEGKEDEVNNKLIRILLIFEFDKYDHAKRMLEERYGEGSTPLSGIFANRVEWEEKKTDIALYRAVRFDRQPCFIDFESRELMSEYEKWLEEYKKDKAVEDAEAW